MLGVFFGGKNQEVNVTDFFYNFLGNRLFNFRYETNFNGFDLENVEEEVFGVFFSSKIWNGQF